MCFRGARQHFLRTFEFRTIGDGVLVYHFGQLPHSVYGVCCRMAGPRVPITPRRYSYVYLCGGPGLGAAASQPAFSIAIITYVICLYVSLFFLFLC